MVISSNPVNRYFFAAPFSSTWFSSSFFVALSSTSLSSLSWWIGYLAVLFYGARWLVFLIAAILTFLHSSCADSASHLLSFWMFCFFKLARLFSLPSYLPCLKFMFSFLLYSASLFLLLLVFLLPPKLFQYLPFFFYSFFSRAHVIMCFCGFRSLHHDKSKETWFLL